MTLRQCLIATRRENAHIGVDGGVVEIRNRRLDRRNRRRQLAESRLCVACGDEQRSDVGVYVGGRRWHLGLVDAALVDDTLRDEREMTNANAHTHRTCDACSSCVTKNASDRADASNAAAVASCSPPPAPAALASSYGAAASSASTASASALAAAVVAAALLALGCCADALVLDTSLAVALATAPHARTRTSSARTQARSPHLAAPRWAAAATRRHRRPSCRSTWRAQHCDRVGKR
jgi:hypothetical protein